MDKREDEEFLDEKLPSAIQGSRGVRDDESTGTVRTSARNVTQTGTGTTAARVAFHHQMYIFVGGPARPSALFSAE
jgi:hypothetical protein